MLSRSSFSTNCVKNTAAQFKVRLRLLKNTAAQLKKNTSAHVYSNPSTSAFLLHRQKQGMLLKEALISKNCNVRIIR